MPGLHLPPTIFQRSILSAVILMVCCLVVPGRVNNPVPVTTVSAASFEVGSIAPGSIVAAFGTQLATGVFVANTLPLPTSLGNTTVMIRDSLGVDRSAELFFVSPGQINYLVPEQASTGPATVTVEAGDGTISTGSVEIKSIGPALFSANSDGQGVPAAVVLRITGDGSQIYEPVSVFDAETQRFVTSPIDMGPQTDQLFLILYGSGYRKTADPNGDQNLNENIGMLLGGDQYPTLFAGEAPGFVGLDQINVPLSRSLIGRGKISLTIAVAGGFASNQVEIEIGGPQGPAPPQITGFGQNMVLAGQTVTIDGQGFSTVPGENLVRISGVEADVLPSTATQLMVRVPFGVTTGTVSVGTPTGQAVSSNYLGIRTSISGMIMTTDPQPLPGVKLKVVASAQEAASSGDGHFVIPGVPIGLQLLEVDTSTLPQGLYVPSISLKLPVYSGRDNMLKAPVQIQPATGPSVTVGGQGGGFDRATESTSGEMIRKDKKSSIETGGIIFDVPDNVTAIFPDGSTSGQLVLTQLQNSRTPVSLPAGIFSSAIVQITPFGVKLNPGGKLTFPNIDQLQAGSMPSLFTLDQNPESQTFGQFIVIGSAVVSADGQKIETAPDAIKETNYFFISVSRPVTTVIGRVLDSDGATPVRKAQVRVRGQETLTDGNGGFVLRDVPVRNAQDQFRVEVNYVRSDGRVDRVDRNNIDPVVNGVTKITPDLVLPLRNSNKSPTILGPPKLIVAEGENRDFPILINDPDQTTPNVTVSGAPFASILVRGNNAFFLRLAPVAGSAGNYTLKITATDDLGAMSSIDVPVDVRANRKPILSVPSVSTLLPGQTFNFVVLATDPDIGQALEFFAYDLPAGATITQEWPNSARFNWIPSAAQTGEFIVTFAVSDNGALSLSDVSNLTLKVAMAPQWTLTSGPTGGIIPALYTDGDFLFAGTVQSGVFRSSDGGVTWENTLPDIEIKVLGGNQAYIFAGTWGGGLHRSADQGKTWQPITLNQTAYITALYVLDSNVFIGDYFGDIFVSTDNGNQWSQLTKAPTPEVKALVRFGTDLFMGTNQSIYKSIDQGMTWIPLTEGYQAAGIGDFLLVDNILMMATGSGVYQLTGNNSAWTPLNNGLETLIVSSLELADSVVYAGTYTGVFMTLDFGQNWVPVTANDRVNDFVLSVNVHGGSLYAGTNGLGVYRLGDMWFDVNQTLNAQPVYAMAARGSEIYAGTHSGGVYRSPDFGQQWISMNNGLPTKGVRNLVVSGNSLLADTGAGIYRFDDVGQVWVSSSLGLDMELEIKALVAGNGLVFTGTVGGGVFRSTDNGSNWQVFNSGLTDLKVNAILLAGSDWFAGTSTGLFRSGDNGQSWTSVSGGLGTPFVTALAFNGAALLACTLDSGVYRSFDLGASWQPIANVQVLHLAASGSVFIASNGNGVIISIDDGTSWAPANDGLINKRIFSLLALPGQIFVGTGGGVYRAN